MFVMIITPKTSMTLFSLMTLSNNYEALYNKLILFLKSPPDAFISLNKAFEKNIFLNCNFY